ncbi:MAG: DUF2782 domain-containing protein [Magnetococcales bacterium]|nr:DUF2782 domain-containing protein [Magnetococcales bacterium]
MKRLLIPILALTLAPALAAAAESAPSAAASDAKGAAKAPAPAAPEAAEAAKPEIKSEGHDKPRKGPLVSEFREHLSDEAEAPETVIRVYEDGSGGVVREFVINGSVFQIEVVPAVGPPYYLVDTTGSGIFDARYAGTLPRLIVPQWVLFRF